MTTEVTRAVVKESIWKPLMNWAAIIRRMALITKIYQSYSGLQLLSCNSGLDWYIPKNIRCESMFVWYKKPQSDNCCRKGKKDKDRFDGHI